MSVHTPMSGETLYASLGGEAALHRTVEAFYASVLVDPLLQPLFGTGQPTHVDHLTAFFGEVLGGPARYTGELGGFPALLEAHRGLHIGEPQRQRFVALFLAAAEQTGLAGAPHLRAALASYLEFGTEVARQNSWAETDADLHPCQEVPRWG